MTRQWVLGDSEDAFIPVSATSPSYVGSGAGERSELLHMHEVGRPAELYVCQWPRRRCAHHWFREHSARCVRRSPSSAPCSGATSGTVAGWSCARRASAPICTPCLEHARCSTPSSPFGKCIHQGLDICVVPWLLTLVGCHRGGTERVGLVHDADESKGQEARNSSALSVPAWMVVRWGQGLRRRTPVRVRFGRTVLRCQACCSLVVRGWCSVPG